MDGPDSLHSKGFGLLLAAASILMTLFICALAALAAASVLDLVATTVSCAGRS